MGQHIVRVDTAGGEVVDLRDDGPRPDRNHDVRGTIRRGEPVPCRQLLGVHPLVTVLDPERVPVGGGDGGSAVASRSVDVDGDVDQRLRA